MRPSLVDIFEIAADALEQGLDTFEAILVEAGPAAQWFPIIGPERVRPRQLLLSPARFSGLRGSSFLDVGYVYAPYIPLQVTPVEPPSES